MRRVGARGILRAGRTLVSSEQHAWIVLALVAAGWALGDAVAAQLGLRELGVVLAALGAAGGYGVSELAVERLARRGRRGQPKYWRGQRFYDDER